jgi:Protein of unknown function (DUF4239)
MIFFLTSQPLWVRRCVSLERLTENNEIAGFKFATIGVLYAVSLAFAIIVVWQKFSDAEVDVVQEAGAAESIYRLSQGLGDKAGVAVRGAVANYLKAAINDDWPAMDVGMVGASQPAKQVLDAVYATLLSPDQQGNRAVVSEMLRQLELVTQTRRARLVAAEGAVPNVIWLALLGWAVVTIGFTFFFGTESLSAQVLMTRCSR